MSDIADLPPPPHYECGDILNPGDLPPMYCMYLWNGSQWVLEEAHCPPGYMCPIMELPPGTPPGPNEQPVLYLYPCPVPV
jgi:hypothetical protein